MYNEIPDFMKDADNVYRTDKFIVKQRIAIQTNSVEDNSIISYDTYYKRTVRRDFIYNLKYQNKLNLEGKRLPSSSYVRKYVA